MAILQGLKEGNDRSGFNRDNWPYYESIDSGFNLGDIPETRMHVVVDNTIAHPQMQK